MTVPASSPATLTAVLFDLDGVLVDSARVVERAWRWWAAEQGLDTDEVLAVIHGRRAAEIVQKFAPDLDPAEQVRRITGFELADDDLTLIPGALECAAVASRGPWAVVTSGGRELAAQRLAAVGFPAPEVLVTGDDVEHGKPDPEPYLRAAAALGVPPGQCVVVEDAPAGVLAGQRAGMAVLAVTTTHPADALAQADQVFPGMAAVAGYLRGQARSHSPRGVGHLPERDPVRRPGPRTTPSRIAPPATPTPNTTLSSPAPTPSINRVDSRLRGDFAAP